MRIANRGIRHGRPLVLLLLLFAISVTAHAAQNQQVQQKLETLRNIPGKFSFIVIGDNRSGQDIYKQFVAMIAEQNPALVLNTGDVISTPGSKEEWNGFWAVSQPVSAPYFLTVGNHDVHPKVLLSDAVYKEQVDLPGNELYYSFAAGNSLFVVLDSFLGDQEKKITGDQLKWLETVLGQSTQKHKFVFLHHPLFSEPGKGHHAGDSLDKYPADRDRLEALFAKTNVDIVFAGHEHFYQRKKIDQVAYIITGGGGAPMYVKDEEGGFYHFVRIVVDGDKVSG